MKNNCYLHGEVVIYQIDSIPKEAKKILINAPYYIVAPSEVTGNHHVIDIKNGVEFYEKDNVLYMKNEKPTSIRCIIENRHDNITLTPGIWEIDKQKEFDYLTMEKRNVAD